MKDATAMPHPPRNRSSCQMCLPWRAGGRGKQDESPKVAIYLFSSSGVRLGSLSGSWAAAETGGRCRALWRCVVQRRVM